MRFDCHDATSLLERLARRERETVFLVGSAVSIPSVPGVGGMLDLIRALHPPGSASRARLDDEIARADNAYSAAFRFVIGLGGVSDANRIVREAVLRARRDDAEVPRGRALDGERADCERLERDVRGWKLTPALEALGRIAASESESFGRTVLTTNFDPLVEVAVEAAGGDVYRTVLDDEGRLDQTEGRGCRVIHTHGDWFRSSTLHTGTQLGQPRPRLRSSLAQILGQKRTLAVFGYGGWDDIIMESVRQVLEDAQDVEIVWAFFEPDAATVEKKYQHLERYLADGTGQGRVTFYADVNCHAFLPRLRDRLAADRRLPTVSPPEVKPAPPPPPPTPPPVVVPTPTPAGTRGPWFLAAGAAGAILTLGAVAWWQPWRPAPPPVACDVVTLRDADLPPDLGADERENLLIAGTVVRVSRDIELAFQRGDAGRIVDCRQRLRDLDRREFAYDYYPYIVWAELARGDQAAAKRTLVELEGRVDADYNGRTGRYAQADELNELARHLGNVRDAMSDGPVFRATIALQVKALTLAQRVRQPVIDVGVAQVATPLPPSLVAVVENTWRAAADPAVPESESGRAGRVEVPSVAKLDEGKDGKPERQDVAKAAAKPAMKTDAPFGVEKGMTGHALVGPTPPPAAPELRDDPSFLAPSKRPAAAPLNLSLPAFKVSE